MRSITVVNAVGSVVSKILLIFHLGDKNTKGKKSYGKMLNCSIKFPCTLLITQDHCSNTVIHLPYQKAYYENYYEDEFLILTSHFIDKRKNVTNLIHTDLRIEQEKVYWHNFSE